MIYVFEKSKSSEVFEKLKDGLKEAKYDGVSIFTDDGGTPICSLCNAGDDFGQCMVLYQAYSAVVGEILKPYAVKEVITIRLPDIDFDAVCNKMRHKPGVDIAFDPVFYMERGAIRVFVDAFETVLTGYGDRSVMGKVIACAESLL